MPNVYPGGGPQITVEALLKQPRLIARALTDLTYQRFVADRFLARGTAEQVAGGASLFQRAESIFPDRDPREVGPRAEYPRTAWTEALFTAAVKKYGLEVPIADEAKRRNQLDVVVRAQRKIANAVVRFVDSIVLDMIVNDPDVLTDTASGDWTTAATDIIGDIASWKQQIYDEQQGYQPDTLIVNTAQGLDMIIDADLRNILPREGGAPKPAAITGEPVPILGLRQILQTETLTAGTVILGESNVAGTIADEAPMADENYVSYNPGDGFPTIYVKMYREENTDETIVRGARFPAAWLSEPGSVLVATGA